MEIRNCNRLITYMTTATALLNRGFDLSVCKILEFLFIFDHNTFSRDLDHAIGGKMLQHPRNYLPGCSQVSGAKGTTDYSYISDVDDLEVNFGFLHLND